MSKPIKTDICVIGGGSGGLSVAAGAVQMGADVTLVEADKMGGDCLNHGCVPSKSLLAAAHLAAQIDTGRAFGIATTKSIDFKKTMAHVADIIAQIEPMDSPERFSKLGVRVMSGKAKFISKRQIKVGRAVVQAKHFVIATGSKPATPPIAGLAKIPYLTNETIFQARARPSHLLVIGGGPIGVEMAQAHRRLGAQVTLIEADRLLARDDPQAVDIIRQQLRTDGVTLLENCHIDKITRQKSGVRAKTAQGDITASHVLVATGRVPNIAALDLVKADVRVTQGRIAVNARLQTSNRRIYAIGDVIGAAQFTHVASYHAGIIIRNILFKIPAKARHALIPRVTYCAPELAHIGMSEAAARARGKAIRVLTWPFAENDRARCERAISGFTKIITEKNGRILGATIVGRGAGDLLAPWILALDQRLGISAMAGLIIPYPTRSEASKRAAGAFYTPTLFGAGTRRLVRLLARLPF